MKFNKKYSVYIAVVAVGAIWLIHDQFSAGSSTAQGAANPSELLVAHSAAPAPQAAQKPDNDAEATLAERFDQLSRQRTINLVNPRDAFVATEWPTQQSAAPAQTDASTNDFVKKHRLISVMVQAKGGSAQIDGRLLRVGQEIDGYKLVAVSKSAATFQSGSARVELKFPDPLPNSNSAAP